MGANGKIGRIRRPMVGRTKILRGRWGPKWPNADRWRQDWSDSPAHRLDRETSILYNSLSTIRSSISDSGIATICNVFPQKVIKPLPLGTNDTSSSLWSESYVVSMLRNSWIPHLLKQSSTIQQRLSEAVTQDSPGVYGLHMLQPRFREMLLDEVGNYIHNMATKKKSRRKTCST